MSLPPAPILTTLVDHRTLDANLDREDWVVVDCRFDLAAPERGEQNYLEAHVPGARYAHLDRDLSSPVTPETGRHPLPDPDRLQEWFGAVGIDPDCQVIAYDDTGGNMAVRLWWLLRWLGHHAVAVLDGGWQAWVGAGHATTAMPPAIRPAAPFGRTPAADMVVDARDIASDLAAGRHGLLLLDARTAERFRGEAEPIDPVAGHIPGAVNLPLQQNLDQDGLFRPPRQLRALYEPVLGARPPQQVAAMCGSGVTACHNLLAMEHAGLRGARLYAGSWSEWIRDPGRPVATGS